MTSSFVHLVHQGAVLRALGAVALSSLAPARAKTAQVLPAPWIEAIVPPRPESLVRDYIRNVGGDPAWYRGVVPPHMFPQWTFPLFARAVAELPYPTTRIVNAGCRIEVRAPLPASEPIHVKVRLESIDEDERRAVLVQRFVTGTQREPEAITGELRAIVPLAKRGEGGERASGTRPTVPQDAKEIAFLRLRATAGRDFAALTGDVNPIHWFAPAARAAGFRGCILHGFATLGRTVEALNRRVFAGDARALSTIDVRFSRPLVLPARVGVYVRGGEVFVGDAPGGGAYLEGRYEAHTAHLEAQES
ncbi:MAG: MaoC/PaaZ C-terminal domain-containing protein [Polyangiaceae bacterium]